MAAGGRVSHQHCMLGLWRVHACSTAFLACFFFHKLKVRGDAAATRTQRGPAAHGWHGAKLSDQNHNCFPEIGSYRNYPKCSLIQNGLAGGKLSASTKVSSMIKNSDRPYQKTPTLSIRKLRTRSKLLYKHVPCPNTSPNTELGRNPV